MHERIHNGANLLESHVFQFDFLNDEFTILPQGLQNIINDPEQRKKLVIYINPPYAEHGNRKQVIGTGENKTSVATESIIYKQFEKTIGTAARELYAQFLIRIYTCFSNCIIANFSTLKGLQAINFKKFRNVFMPQLKSLFLVPANSFDNVNGIFPIGFFIWDTAIKCRFSGIIADTYNSQGELFGTKNVHSYDENKLVIDWLRPHFDKTNVTIGYLRMKNTDIQNKSQIFITSMPSKADFREKTFTYITKNNLIQIAMYLTIRGVIEATWLNDRDQFLYPNDGWKTDREFHADCLVYALFHGQNRISSEHGINHWIPFTENEVNAPDCFASHFMTDFMAGKNAAKVEETVQGDLFANNEPSVKTCHGASLQRPIAEHFSNATLSVMNAGREVWRYYMQQPNINVNASLYDIKAYFKGRDAKGRMNATSPDEHFNTLMEDLRIALQDLAKKIEAKVYEYGFLK